MANKITDNLQQAYLTVPLAIAYWVADFGIVDGDAYAGYLIFGLMLSIGAFTDAVKAQDYLRRKK